jgi:NAD(P)H-dependent FMN reductase
MHITIVVGSHRQISNSSKVGSLVSELLLTQNPDLVISTIDLGKNPLPMWDEKVWKDDPTWNEILKPHREILNTTDGLVIISPEYSGMASPALKNFFLFWGGETLAHKPAIIIGVTENPHNGTYPIAELRMSSYKNTRLLYIPDHVIVRKVDDLPNSLDEVKEKDQLRTISRIDHGTKILMAYSKALQPMRATTDFEFETFTYGM